MNPQNLTFLNNLKTFAKWIKGYFRWHWVDWD